MELVRKHILIPKKLEQRLEKIAKERKKSLSDTIREALQSYTESIPSIKNTHNTEENLRALVGLYSNKERDLSVNHDKYLYEDQNLY
jgi:metal-responsive CopG/Arc/MetJ family transcriptional regulator